MDARKMQLQQLVCKAVAAVKRGDLTIRHASEYYGVPYSTAQGRIMDFAPCIQWHTGKLC